MYPIVASLWANKLVRYALVIVLCLTIGFTRGCSYGTKAGRAEVQERFDKYVQKVAEDIAHGNQMVEDAIKATEKAQAEAAALRNEERNKLLREMKDVKSRMEKAFRADVGDDCKPTADELRVIEDVFGENGDSP